MIEFVETATTEEAVIKVVGVGGCGGNAVDHMIRQRRAGRGVHHREHRRPGAQAQPREAPAAARLDVTKGWAPAPSRRSGARPRMEDRERIAELIAGARHAVHHRRHGRRHRHGRGAGGRARSRARWASSPSRWSPSRSPSRASARRSPQAGIEQLKQHVDSLIIIPNDQLMQVLGEDVTDRRRVPRLERRAERRRRGHRRGHQLPRHGERGLRRRAHGDEREGRGDDGLGHAPRHRARADRGRAGGGEPAARGHPPLRRARRAGEHHREPLDEAEGGARGDEHHPVVHRRGRDRDLRRVFDEAIGDALRVTIVATGLGGRGAARQQKPQRCRAAHRHRRRGSARPSTTRSSTSPTAIRRTAVDRSRRCEQSGVDMLTSRRSCGSRRTEQRADGAGGTMRLRARANARRRVAWHRRRPARRHPACHFASEKTNQMP